MSLLYDALQKAEADRAKEDSATGAAEHARATTEGRGFGSRLLRLVVAAGVAYVGAVMIVSMSAEAPSRGELIEWAIGGPRSGVAREKPPADAKAPLQATAAPIVAQRRDLAAMPAEVDRGVTAAMPESASFASPAPAPLTNRIAAGAPPSAVTVPPVAPEPALTADQPRAPEVMAAAAPSAVAAPAPAEPPARARGFSVQLGAFKSRDNASRLRERLTASHGVTAIETLRSETGLWMVRIGPYADRRTATTAMVALARAGFRGFVVAAD